MILWSLNNKKIKSNRIYNMDLFYIEYLFWVTNTYMFMNMHTYYMHMFNKHDLKLEHT